MMGLMGNEQNSEYSMLVSMLIHRSLYSRHQPVCLMIFQWSKCTCQECREMMSLLVLKLSLLICLWVMLLLSILLRGMKKCLSLNIGGSDTTMEFQLKCLIMNIYFQFQMVLVDRV